MARRKSLIRIPFLKVRIDRKTVFNIIGFIIIAAAFIILISTFGLFSSEDKGLVLGKIKQIIFENLGIIGFLSPFILFLISGHFFSSRKFKFVKPNITIGSILLFISLLGVFRSGIWGQFIYDSLTTDFSLTGAMIILLITFFMGLILFLDTSVDAFFIFIVKGVKAISEFIKSYILGATFSSGKKEDRNLKSDDDFIFGKEMAINKHQRDVATQTSVSKSKGDIELRPLVSRSANWVYPPLSILQDVSQKEADRGDVKKNASIIEKTLESFGIRAQVAEVNYGPSVTQYALKITMGTKLSKITGLSNNLALSLAAPTGQVRIEAPIPGRSMVGIEIPNIRPEIVTLKTLLGSSLFKDNSDPLLVPLGLDVSGNPQAATIEKMPHVLIAGATNSGKSVLLNSWISTFLFRTKPEELRLILVDPKRVELTLYNGIPHLLTEVIVEPDKIISALRWTVSQMEKRYKEFSKAGVRNIAGYNALPDVQKEPYIMFIIDELADLMIFAPGDSEDLLTRIAQMSRATGIHLILATQRPSVDIITGLMKANIPTRIAFNVSSLVDSRVIIDMPGAEKLLGRGDMLYLPPDQAKPKRIQGPFITEKEVNEMVKFLKSQAPQINYTEEITQQETRTTTGGFYGTSQAGTDALFNEAVSIISQFDKASASLLQRRLSIGYARAARILDQLEAAGYVGPAEGSKPREVLSRREVLQEE
jgi:S-DNA-T family DNA segregation ATPase FtsK/SpoIIIE